MPEKLQMVPGGLEEKVFASFEGRFANAPGLRTPDEQLRFFFCTVAVAMPVLMTLLLSLLAGVYRLIQLAASNVRLDGMTSIFAFSTGHLLFLLFSCAAATFNLWLVRNLTRKCESRLRESDLMLRILDGWEPELGDGPLTALLRRAEAWRGAKSLLSRSCLSFTQLPFIFGFRARPFPPRLQTVLVMMFAVNLSLAAVIYGLRSSLSHGVLTETTIVLVGLVLVVACNVIGYPMLAEGITSSLLNVHLREIDNGVIPGPDMSTGTAEAQAPVDDNSPEYRPATVARRTTQSRDAKVRDV